MKLQHAKNEWEFTLKADAFHYQSLKIPEAAEWEEKDEDPAGKLLEQIYLIEKVVKVMNDLYGLFLKIRLSPQWESKESKLLQKWLERSI